MMNDQYATITVHRDYDRVTGDYFITHVTWEPPHLPARINERTQDLDTVKRFFDIEKLTEADTHESYFYGHTYVRLDAGMSYAYHRYMNFWNNRFLYPWRWVEVRLILTLQVWGLAKVMPGEYITWSAVGRK